MRFAFLALVAFCFGSSYMSAAEQIAYEDLEYVRGKDGINERYKGVLLVSRDEITFVKKRKDGEQLFSVPFKSVKSVVEPTEVDGKSTKSSEYVLIKTESDDHGAEPILIRCHSTKDVAIMLAKISFFTKKAHEASALARAQQQGIPEVREITIPEGTEFTVVTVEEISSKTASKGDPVAFKVAEDVEIDGVALIPSGRAAKGTVAEVKSNGFLGKSGKLDLHVDSVSAIDGQKIPLRAVKATQGKGRLASTVVVTALVSPLGLLIRGKHAVIPAGTKITVYTDEERKISISETKLPSASKQSQE